MREGKYQESDKSTVGTAVTFLLIGLGAGGLGALLFGPKTGKQMRRDLRKRYDDARDAMEDFAEVAKDRIDEVRERGSEWVETAREKVEPLRSAMRKK